MDIRKIKERLPEGFQVRRSGGKICIYAEDRREEMSALAGEEEIARRAVLRLRGRGRPAVVPAGGESLVVRHYYHGGILRRLTRDLFFGSGRFLNELRLLTAARRGGAAVPRPAGLLIEPVLPFLFRADLVTVYIPASVDFLTHYRKIFSPGAVSAPGDMAAIVAAAGRQAALLHRAGIIHGDLQVKNILVLPGRRPPEVFILDLDLALPAPVGEAARRKNLWRLYRSFLKMRLSLPAVSRLDPIRFLRAYAPKDGAFRRRVIDEVRRRRRASLHLVKWRLSFRLRGGYYARSMDIEKVRE